MFILKIGDWSGDGHKVKYEFKFKLLNGTSLDQLRKAHFKAEDKYGSVNDYLTSDFNIPIALVKKHFPEVEERTIPEELALAWMGLLMDIDNKAKVAYVKENLPSFHFYGDGKGSRIIDNVGYNEVI